MRGTGSNAGVSPVLTERAGVFALASPWASLHTDGLSEARCRACPTTDAAKGVVHDARPKILTWSLASLVLLLAALVVFIATFDWNLIKPTLNERSRRR